MKTLVLLVLASSVAHAEPEHPFAISSDPVGWLTDRYGVDATFGVHDRIAIRLGGSIDITLPDVENARKWDGRVGLALFFDRLHHGAFVEPGIVAHRDFLTTLVQRDPQRGPMLEAYPHYGVGAQMRVGWQWTFPSGLTLTAALSAMKLWFITPGRYGQPPPATELRVGYVF